MTKPAYFYRQSGVVPFRLKNNQYEILLITTRKRRRWTIPKGIVEPGLAAAASAVKEAWEEAGIRGSLLPDLLGVYQQRKWGKDCCIDVFLFQVEAEAGVWPESGFRQRRWFPVAEVHKAVDNDDLKHLLQQLPERLSGQGVAQMKKLILVRHAKSDWGMPELNDFDRPLNKRGEKNAPTMGERLQARGVIPECIYSSPARRARETARLLAETLAFEDAVVFNEDIYEAHVDDLLDIIQSFDDAWQTVMLVGHNPGMTELANLLGELKIYNLPTCGMVGLELTVSSWQKVAEGGGRSWFYDYPKNPAPG